MSGMGGFEPPTYSVSQSGYAVLFRLSGLPDCPTFRITKTAPNPASGLQGVRHGCQVAPIDEHDSDTARTDNAIAL